MEAGGRWKVALAVGYLGFIGALLAAHGDPARGYELSIYRATPVEFWAGVGVALATSLFVALGTTSRRVRASALLLVGLAITAIAGLPVIRGYYFYGAGDSLSHLGFARTFVSGANSPLNLLHPGTHLVSIFLGKASGGSLPWAIMLTVVAYFVAFLVFVPLCVRAISDREVGTVVGMFSAALLLPINNVSVFPLMHPTSQAILLVPFVLYLVVNYLFTDERDGLLSASPLGVVLALSSLGLVLVHPQQALNVIVLLVVIAGLQFLARRYRAEHAIASHRSMYAQVMIAMLVFAVWAPQSPRFYGAVEGIITGLLGGALPGDEVAGRAPSLTTLGGSLEELFLKLFLVALVYSVIVGLLVLVNLTSQSDDPLVTYLAAGLVAIFGIFFVYAAASYTTQYFRHLGFMMAIVTVLGAVGITYAVSREWQWSASRGLYVGLVVFFVLLLPLSVASLHPSPYMYQGSASVPQGELDGYETAFENRDPTVRFAGVSGGPTRYVDAIYGPRTSTTAEFPGKRAFVPGSVFDTAEYGEFYDEPRYVPVTESDVSREVTLYEGFRYSKRGFDALDATPGVDRVQSSGAFDLYLVGNETSAGPR